MVSRIVRCLTGSAVALVSVVAMLPASASAGTYSLILNGSAMCTVGSFAANVTAPNAAYSTSCGPGGITINSPAVQTNGQDREVFQINSPDPALAIAGFSAQLGSEAVDSGYGAGTYWASGGANWANSATSAFVASNDWGVQMLCGDKNYCAADGGSSAISMSGVTLTVTESQSPTVTEGGLWNENGWVWNAPGDPWNVSLNASDPSGVCTLDLSADGGTPQGLLSSTPNQAAWQQCPATGSENIPVDTTQSVPSSGTVSLLASSTNAAGVLANPSSAINVDNVTPTISIAQANDHNALGTGNSSPTEMQITTSTGPSGISSLGCKVNGTATAAPTPEPDTSGVYTVLVPSSAPSSIQCTVANGAVNPQGQHNSATATAESKEYATLTSYFLDGKKHTGLLKVAHGQASTVHGTLTDSAGKRMSGATVTVQSVPGPGPSATDITTLGTVTTDKQGDWSIDVPGGPSRIITALYSGDAIHDPTGSVIHLRVHAGVEIHVSTQKLPWSKTLVITGKLVGGYVPPNGVPMRLLLKLPGRKTLVSPENFTTGPDGTFTVKLKLASRKGSEKYGVSVQSFDEVGYPFIAGTSTSIPVTFG